MRRRTNKNITEPTKGRNEHRIARTRNKRGIERTTKLTTAEQRCVQLPTSRSRHVWRLLRRRRRRLCSPSSSFLLLHLLCRHHHHVVRFKLRFQVARINSGPVARFENDQLWRLRERTRNQPCNTVQTSTGTQPPTRTHAHTHLRTCTHAQLHTCTYAHAHDGCSLTRSLHAFPHTPPLACTATDSKHRLVSSSNHIGNGRA